MNNIKKHVKKIGTLLSVVSIIFLFYSIYKLHIDFNQIVDLKGFLFVSIIGVLNLTLCVYLMAYGWCKSITYLSNKQVKFKGIVKVYAKSNIGKYLPGNVMHFVERNIFAKGQGLSQIDVTTSTIVEIFCQVFVAITISIAFSRDYLFDIMRSFFSGRYLIAIGVIIPIFICMAFIGYEKNSKIQIVVKKILRVNYIPTFLCVCLLYTLVLFLQGFQLLMLLNLGFGCVLPVQQSLLVIAFFVMAWMIGFVVPGAPGGLGIRETVIVLLLSDIIGEDKVLCAALLFRLISILADVLAYFISFGIKSEINNDIEERNE